MKYIIIVKNILQKIRFVGILLHFIDKKLIIAIL